MVFKIQTKVLVFSWNDVFCVTTVHVQMFTAVLRGFWMFGFGLYPVGFLIFYGCCVRGQCLKI